MTTRFQEMDGKDVEQAFPQFYDKRGRFFEIVHQGQEIGFLGIRPLTTEECEIEAYIFPPYRNALSKGLVFDVLDFPQQLGFKQSMMTTKRPRFKKWLHFLVRCGKLSVAWSAQKEIFTRIHP